VRGVAFVDALLLGDDLEGCPFLIDLLVVYPIPLEESLPAPRESSPTMLQIVLEHALVVQALLIEFLPAAASLVVLELAAVEAARGESQHALPVTLAVDELPVVVVAVGPVVVSLAVGQVLPEGAGVGLSRLETHGSVAVLHEGLKLTLVAGLLFGKDSETFDGVAMPLAHVGDIALSLPHAAALLTAIPPLPVVHLSVVPLESPTAVAFAG
jgi:hypothetical protein